MLGFGKRKSVSPGNIAAVVSGQIIPIEKVKDEAFAKKMMGDGVAIVPSDDYIVSPCDGTCLCCIRRFMLLPLQVKTEWTF